MGKEFEKQWECGMLSGSPSSFHSEASTKEAAQFNWKAALKWVIREYYESNRALGSIVNEELEEK